MQGRTVNEADERRQSTVAMTVVGRDELDAYGDNSILDVLQRLPGISLDGDLPKLRGMGGGTTQILLNGQPAPPGFSLDTLAPSEIERIEIIKGPTAEFGGVAGTINVILRSAPRLRQREWRSNLGYRALAPQGSTVFSWGDRFGSVGVFLPLNLYKWANASASQVQRLSRLPSGEISQQQLLGRDQWRGGGLNLSPRLDWKLGEEDALQWQAFLQRNESDNRSEREIRALLGPVPGSVLDRSVSRGTFELARSQLQWVQKQADGTRYELKASGQTSSSRSASASQGQNASAAPGALRDTLNSQRDATGSVGARWRQPIGQHHTLTLGADLDDRHRRELRRQFENTVEQITGTVGVPFTARSARMTAFVQDEWALSDRWSVMGGLRAEHARVVASSLTVEQVNRFTQVSPLLHLRHALDDKGRDVLRASLSRSIRVPDLGLLMPRYSLNGTYDKDTPNTPIAADSAGNARLLPEKSSNVELSWEQRLGNNGVASVGYFHRRIDGLIRRRITRESVAEASVPRWVSRPANIGRATSSGLEFEIKGQGAELLRGVWPAAPRTLQLRASLSLYRSAVEQIDDPDARLDGQAPWSSTVGFDHAVAKSLFSYGGNLAYTPAFATQQTDLQRVWRGASHRVDVYALWRFNRQVQLRLSVNNLLPADSLSSSRVDNLDGFAAASETRRQNHAQYTANLVLRF